MKKNTEDIELILKSKGVKPTAVRNLVLSKFYETEMAFSLKSIVHELDWTDQSTVFRSLKTFVDKGILHSIDNGSESKLYALCDTRCSSKDHHDYHPHFKCTKCGNTFCIESATIPKIQVPEGFSIKNLTLNVEGLCNNCN